MRVVMPTSLSSTAIDLSRIPAPEIIQQVDYEATLTAMTAQLVAIYPEFSALIESDPAIKLLEVAAYFVMLERQAFNERARGLLVAYATGGDLDQLALLFGIERLTITPANVETGAPAVMESDEALRRRILLAPDGYSVAGPATAYAFHALTADGEVLDASAISPEPGEVLVSILARSGDGTAPAPLIATVTAAVNGDTVRPLTDLVTVRSAEIIHVAITATLTLFYGPDTQMVVDNATAALAAYIASTRRLGRDLTRSGIIAALHAPGVQNVALTSPVADVVCNATQAVHVTATTVTLAGTSE